MRPIAVAIGSADLMLDPFVLPGTVVETIENLGYDARIIQKLQPLTPGGSKKSVEVGIKVDGIKNKKEANRVLNLMR